jgi:glycerol uptake facilitator-like aquaporin
MNRRIQGNIGAVAIYLGTLGTAFSQPHITTQPTDQSVSLGAKVTHLVAGTTLAPPLSYQWRFNVAEIIGATARTLILTNIQVVSAGGYSVVVTDSSGSVTSLVRDSMWTRLLR